MANAQTIEKELALMGGYIPVQICFHDWYWVLGYVTENAYNIFKNSKFENVVKDKVFFREEQMMVYANIIQFLSRDTTRHYETDTFRRHEFYNNGLRSDYIKTISYQPDLIRCFDEDIVAWGVEETFKVQPLGFRTIGYDYLFRGMDNGLSSVFNKRLTYSEHLKDLSDKMFDLKLENPTSEKLETAYQELKLVSESLEVINRLMYKKEG